jgi:prefoldin subunit 5
MATGCRQDNFLESKVASYQEQIHEMKEEIKRLNAFHDEFDESRLKLCLEKKDQELMTLRRTLVSIESEVTPLTRL